MTTLQFKELLEECLKIQAQIKMNPHGTYGFVVCIGNRVYFNLLERYVFENTTGKFLPKRVIFSKIQRPPK